MTKLRWYKALNRSKDKDDARGVIAVQGDASIGIIFAAGAIYMARGNCSKRLGRRSRRSNTSGKIA